MKYQTEIKETILLTRPSKRIKYPWINLPKNAKDLYSPNRKTLWKKPKMTQTDRGTCPVLGLEESILSKWLYSPRQSADSMHCQSNCQWRFSQNWNKKMKVCMETQKPWVVKTILRKNRTGGIILPDFRLYYRASVIKTVWLLPQKQTHGSVEQDRKPRYKPIRLWVINLQQRRKEYAMEKSQCL